MTVIDLFFSENCILLGHAMTEAAIKLFDAFISYARQDRRLVKKFIQKLEHNGFSICWDVRDFDPSLTQSENRDLFVKICPVSILMISQSYLSRKTEWQYFLPYLQSRNKSTVKDVLDSKDILCVIITECDVPEEFSEQVMLDWTEEEIRQQFWKKVFKYIAGVKKRSIVRKALFQANQTLPVIDVGMCKQSPNQEVDHNSCHSVFKIANSHCGGQGETFLNDAKFSCWNDKSVASSGEQENNNDMRQKSDMVYAKTMNIIEPEHVEESEIRTSGPGGVPSTNDAHFEEVDESKSPSYVMYDKVYPHLLSDSFTAEDEDLTKDDVNNLTLKMEDIEALMLVNSDKYNNKPSTSMKFASFSSQYEKIKLLDALQNLYEDMNKKIAVCSDLLRKKCYKRLSNRYNICIIDALNGWRNDSMLASLPLLTHIVDSSDVRGFQCCCCDVLFHSQRALDIHFENCVKSQWMELMK